MNNPSDPLDPEPSAPRWRVAGVVAQMWVVCLLFTSWSLAHQPDIPLRPGWGIGGFAWMPFGAEAIACFWVVIVMTAARIPPRAQLVEPVVGEGERRPAPTSLWRFALVEPWRDVPRAFGSRATLEASLRAALPRAAAELAPGAVETSRIFALWSVTNQLVLPVVFGLDGALVTWSWTAGWLGFAVGAASGFALRLVGTLQLARALGVPAEGRSWAT